MNTIDFDRHRKQGRAPEWDAARRVLGDAAPPDHVEAALLQAFARHHRQRPWYRRWSLESFTPWVSIVSVACVLALVIAGVRPVAPAYPDPEVAVAADGFVALVPADRIASAQPQLKEADLSRQALVQMGIPINADAPNEMVHTELLVAASGEPLAIRLAVN